MLGVRLRKISISSSLMKHGLHMILVRMLFVEHYAVSQYLPWVPWTEKSFSTAFQTQKSRCSRRRWLWNSSLTWRSWLWSGLSICFAGRREATSRSSIFLSFQSWARARSNTRRTRVTSTRSLRLLPKESMSSALTRDFPWSESTRGTKTSWFRHNFSRKRSSNRWLTWQARRLCLLLKAKTTWTSLTSKKTKSSTPWAVQSRERSPTSFYLSARLSGVTSSTRTPTRERESISRHSNRSWCSCSLTKHSA